MTIQSQSFDVATYLSEGWARRQRLLNPPNAIDKQKAIPAPKPTERPPVRLVWSDADRFDAHVTAYRVSSAFAKTPREYLGRRSLELGFTADEIVAPFNLFPFAMARRMLSWELREKFGLKELQISRILKRDHSCVYKTFKGQRPTEDQTSMRLVLEPGMTFMRSLEWAYRGGMLYSEMNATYRVSDRSIRFIARRMHWPRRGKSAP
ncbi:hypothetical protein [Rhizobium sp. BK456]|uniref:hypothetical protein n=1 Tax=Rhizobium sp. BK456 TaxID=2587007 RepID=UPI001610F35A|nr:hypothetical protein [Rhizobium sp. BK456]MBB3521071.1 hypothetical protein [Rhizobium sp. BK456]